MMPPSVVYLRSSFAGLILVLPMLLLGQIELLDFSKAETINEGDYKTYSITAASESGELLTYEWNFGDGTIKSLLERSSTGYSYKNDGTYSLVIKVSDESGHSAVFTSQIIVKNKAPEIKHLSGSEMESVKTSARFKSVVYDSGNDDLHYNWDFGDGNSLEGSNLKSVNHTYAQKGVYSVKLDVEDGDGGKDSKTISVVVEQDWYGSVSGSMGGQMSGGAGFLYQNRYHNETGALTRCFRQLVVYDDNRQSYFIFAISTDVPFFNNTHTITDAPHYETMSCFAEVNVPPDIYPVMKGRFIFMEAKDAAIIEQRILIPPIFNQLAVTEAEWARMAYYGAISGEISVDPRQGDYVSGQFRVDMKENKDENPRYLSVSGSFNFKLNRYSIDQLEMENCEEEFDDFELLSYHPKNEKETVDPEFPCIETEFSEEIDITSFNNSNVKLGYYDKDYNFITVPLRFEMLDEKRVRFVPTSPLRKGIRYEVIVNNGRSKIKSKKGGTLTDEYLWKFKTPVEISDYRIRVYQTIADQPLVPNKNAMVRLQLDWNVAEDVAESSAVKEFDARVLLRNSGGNIVGYDLNHEKFKHSSAYSQEDLQKGRNAIEIYGWEPQSTDGTSIEVEITPYNRQCEADPIRLRHNVRHLPDDHEISIQYFIAKIGDWTDEVPQADKEMINQIMRNTVKYSYQIFPSSRVTALNMGSISYGQGEDSEGLDNRAILDQFLDNFYYNYAINNSASHFVIFYPFTIPNQRGSFKSKYFKLEDGNYSKRKRIIELEAYEGFIPRAAAAHELGHSFELSHNPNVQSVSERAQAESRPIDSWLEHNSHNHLHGFRIYDNNDGANKNCDEENEESNLIVDFMFPSLKNAFEKDVWISNKDYQNVISHLERYGSQMGNINLSPTDSYEWVSVNPPFKKESESESIHISGLINTKTGEVKISRTSVNSDNAPNTTKENKYKMVCFNEANIEIAEAGVRIIESIDECSLTNNQEWKSFNSFIKIPINEKASKLSFLKENKEVKSINISKNKPSVKFTTVFKDSIISNDFTLEWEGIDQDGDELNYQLLYSPNGIEDWLPIFNTNDSKQHIKIGNLLWGEAPAFKLVVSDGFNKQSTRLAVNIEFPMKIINYGPRRKIDRDEEIFIHFSSPIAQELDLSNHIELFMQNEGVWQPIPSSFTWSQDLKVITINPLLPLKEDEIYEVRYGLKKIPDNKSSELSAEAIKESLLNNIFKEREKKVEKVEKKEETLTPGEFFADVLDLPKWMRKKKPKEEVEKAEIKEKKGVIEKKAVIPTFKIKSISGNECSDALKWQFSIQS